MKPTLTIQRDGTKLWELDGEIHNEDGPAVELPSGKKEYYLNGLYYKTKEQWQAELDKRKNFDTLSESEQNEILNRVHILINKIKNIRNKKSEYERLIRNLDCEVFEIQSELLFIKKRNKLDIAEMLKNELIRDSARNT